MVHSSIAESSSAVAILEAGGLGADDLERSLDDCMGDLAPGQVLCVITHTPDGAAMVMHWCLATGHQLLPQADAREDSEFHIRKR